MTTCNERLNIKSTPWKHPSPPSGTARLTGFVYFIFALTAIYGYLYVSSKAKIVPGDAAATAANIIANEFLYRTGILRSIISVTLFIVTVMLLYKLLRPVHEFQARLMGSW